jgi:hypothetical protein
MKVRFTDAMKAKAAIAHLMLVEGWQMGRLPQDVTDKEWCDIANHILDCVENELAKNKVVLLGARKRRRK